MNFDYLDVDNLIENINDFDDSAKDFSKPNTVLNIKINKELKKKFYIKCIQKGTSMSKALKDFILEYVNK